MGLFEDIGNTIRRVISEAEPQHAIKPAPAKPKEQGETKEEKPRGKEKGAGEKKKRGKEKKPASKTSGGGPQHAIEPAPTQPREETPSDIKQGEGVEVEGAAKTAVSKARETVGGAWKESPLAEPAGEFNKAVQAEHQKFLRELEEHVLPREQERAMAAERTLSGSGTMPIRPSRKAQEIAAAGEKTGEDIVRGLAESPFIIAETPAFAYELVKEPGKTLGGMKEYAVTRPFRLAGNLIGTSAVGKGIGRAAKGVKTGIRFAGKTEIPAEEVIPESVRAGEEAFPMTRGVTPEDLVAEYRVGSPRARVSPEAAKALTGEGEPYLGFHATDVAKKMKRGFEAKTEATRPSDVPGLYVSSGVSPHFLRLPGGGAGYRLGLPGQGLVESILGGREPGVLSVGFKEARRIPRKSVGGAREFLLGPAEEGVAYTTPGVERGLPGPVETELVLSPKSLVEPVGEYGFFDRLLGREFEYYTRVQEEKTPLYRMRSPRPRGRGGGPSGLLDEIKRERMRLEEAAKEYSYKPPKGEPIEVYPPPISRAPVSRPKPSRPPRISYPKVSTPEPSKPPISRAPVSGGQISYPEPSKPPISRAPISRAPVSRPKPSRPPRMPRVPAPPLFRPVPKRRKRGSKGEGEQEVEDVVDLRDWFRANPVPTFKDIFGGGGGPLI